MDNKFSIVLINHSFQINYFSRRWQLFAEKYPNVEVTLLAPEEYEWYSGKTYSFGESKKQYGKTIDIDNYHVRLFKRRNRKYIGWDSPDMKSILCEIKPDIIYHIGTHNTLFLKQLLKIRKKYLKNTKVIAFSMRGPAFNLLREFGTGPFYKTIARRGMYYYLKNRLDFINKNVDAFFCHYPDAVKCFRDEGYKGPIYMQTQVGVNEEWFHEDLMSRKEIRSKYGISDQTFVFGSASRFAVSKGVDVILKSLPKDGDWKYLMMGDGSAEDRERLMSIINERGIQDKVIVTGFVDWYDMAKYWNAVDCAIHVPLTTPTWEETFSLAVVQPMLTEKPIIGDDSGSVPYQIGFEDMIVPEGDIDALRDKIEWALSNKEKMTAIGLKMYQRTKKCFEVKQLNDLFYRTLVEDVLPGKYDMSKADMTYGQKIVSE
jgi:glycosyltransferase involved in cell wall biosynthesis